MNTNDLNKLNPIELFNLAEKCIKEGNDTTAKEIYTKLLDFNDAAQLACFRLGEIENRFGNVEESYKYHKRALELDKNLAARITLADHPYHNYIYEEVEEETVENCPLCGGLGELYSCYNMITNLDLIQGFNPIRIWKICDDCNHLFSSSLPKRIDEILSRTAPTSHIKPEVGFLPLAGDILANIKTHTKGNGLLEVGVGAGEMAAAAKEMLYDVTGVEIRPAYAENVSKRLNIPVHAVNFLNFNSDKLFNVIILGDVIEHVSNPKELIKKAYDLLDTNGVIWISTPNFESAFTNIMKDTDPMWRVCEHLNYFSYKSLKKALKQIGFKPVDYRISRHYNGSMEVIAIK